jgi:hypothetical protein
MSTRMIFNISHPLGMLRNHCPELSLNFLASCSQAQPQSGLEEEPRLVELATHVKSSMFAKVIA